MATMMEQDLVQGEQADEQLAALTGAVQTLRTARRDAVANTRALVATATPVPDGGLPARERLRLTASTPDGNVDLTLTDTAHQQMAERLAIPRSYYERLLEHHPDLLAENVTALMHREPASRMLRMLHPSYNDDMGLTAARTGAKFVVRAVLSDRYRPLDHDVMLDAIGPHLAERGLRVLSWMLDPDRITVKVALPERTLDDVRRAHGFDPATAQGYHVADQAGRDRAWVAERLAFGAVLGNSETGAASLSVAPYARVVRCLNGIIVTERLAIRHVGGRQEEGGWMGDDTKRLDDAATMLKVRDRLIEAVSDDTQLTVAKQIAAAAGTPLGLPDDVPLLRFVDTFGEKLGLTQRERDLLQEETINEQLAGGYEAPSRWTLSQAMTATARRIGDGAGQRRNELEALGWQVLTDATAKLVQEASRPFRRN